MLIFKVKPQTIIIAISQRVKDIPLHWVLPSIAQMVHTKKPACGTTIPGHLIRIHSGSNKESRRAGNWGEVSKKQIVPVVLPS